MTDTKKVKGQIEQDLPVENKWLKHLLRAPPKIPKRPKQKKSLPGQQNLFSEDIESEHD